MIWPSPYTIPRPDPLYLNPRHHMSLMQKTRSLLKSCDKTIPEIYAELYGNGSEITIFWLRKFSSGEIQNPSVNRVEELYTYLTGQPVIKN